MLTADDVPRDRPVGLHLVSIEATWWRLDARVPHDWEWRSYETQRGRFDPPGGRVRYAARTERGAFRERFAERRRRIRPDDASTAVVALTGRLRVLDLRSESTLDRLGLDAEISTGRSTRVWAASAVLTDRLSHWYGERVHGIAYTSRTTPQTSANLAFFRWAPLVVTEVSTLAERVDLLRGLIADDGFRVELPDWF